MCANQSTYCYPKDCLKPGDFMRHDTTKAITKSSTKISRDIEKPAVFEVDDQETYELNAFIDNKYKTDLKNG